MTDFVVEAVSSSGMTKSSCPSSDKGGGLVDGSVGGDSERLTALLSVPVVLVADSGPSEWRVNTGGGGLGGGVLPLLDDLIVGSL